MMIGVCWPAMILLMTIETAHLPLMAVATILAVIEREAPGARPRWRLGPRRSSGGWRLAKG